jgi:hypothetical protein
VTNCKYQPVVRRNVSLRGIRIAAKHGVEAHECGEIEDCHDIVWTEGH